MVQDPKYVYDVESAGGISHQNVWSFTHLHRILRHDEVLLGLAYVSPVGKDLSSYLCEVQGVQYKP